ncbi:lipid-binding SYLF domain-containing protein [Rhodopirellula rubra]|uniref:Lipid-binding SYLF domain-containing protein n=1 Tax=Aporhodopirellula rubra TaxID=980271 RepID=A0A7W5E3Z6_9BACT|nr:hypothetical protein [Aporhodopirellula rubra]MBB3208907.1 lipid-binding SYLF domain-containing protein [Aporhodopirellula rubra]
MSDTQKPIAVVYSMGKQKCSFSGKSAEGAVVSFADKSVTREFLSWPMIRKLLAFKEKANAQPEPSGGHAERQP